MARYIDAEAFENDMRIRYCKRCTNWHGERCCACEILSMIGEVADAPTADVQEVKHGRWIVCGIFDDFLKCSICGSKKVIFSGIEFNYCPNCGAKMDEKENEK